MAKDGPATRERILEAAYKLFYRGGFARTGVDAIADAAGITKRTLYYHFDSKAALITAVLDVQHRLSLKLIERWAGPPDGDPATMVRNLFAAFEAWAREPRWRGSGFTRAAMEFADSPGHPARAAARRHKAAIETLLAQRFAMQGIDAAPLLARQLVLLIEGCNALILVHGDASYAQAGADAAATLVERYHARNAPGRSYDASKAARRRPRGG